MTVPAFESGAALFRRIYVVGLLLILAAFVCGQEMLVVALVGVALLAWIATVAPLVLFVVALALYAIPLGLQATGAVAGDIGVVFAGLRPLDFALVAMLGATIARVLSGWRNFPGDVRRLMSIAGVLWTFLLLEVVRNVGAYGISAFGEFRSRFLLLVIPGFVATFIATSRQRKRVEVALFIIGVPYVVLVTPVVAMSKGWGIGPESRFFPAATALGVVYALIWLFVAIKERSIPTSPGAALLMAAPCAALLFADSHRSVWLAIVAALMVLVATGEVQLKSSSVTWITLALLVALSTIAAVSAVTGFNPISYVENRLLAVTSPLQDQTAAWRLYVWRAQVGSIFDNPLIGQGFGGYFDVYVPELDRRTDIFPHSLYVLSAVKVGLLGLSMLLLAGFESFRVMLRRVRSSVGEARVALLLGCVAIASLVAYGVAYSWDFFSLTWIGLGLSACLNSATEDESGSVGVSGGSL